MKIGQNNETAELDRRIENLVKLRSQQDQRIEKLIHERYIQDEELQRLAEAKRKVAAIRLADPTEYIKSLIEAPMPDLSVELGKEKIEAIVATDTFKEVYQILYISSVKLSELLLSDPVAYHLANLQVQNDLNIHEVSS